MIDISRSAYEDFIDCPRKGYYKQLYAGTGLQEAIPPLAPSIGLAVHKGLEKIMLGKDLEEALMFAGLEWESIWAGINEEVLADSKIAFSIEEGGALVEALLRGWYRNSYPSFIERFRILSVEQETRTLLAPNVRLKSRRDVDVIEKPTGRVFVINWKTTNTKKDWTLQWVNEIQPMLECLAAQDALGMEVAGGIFEGLYKGRPSEGITPSPLIYGYRKDGVLRTTYTAGWKRHAIWREGPDALKDWIARFPEDQLSEQFLRSEPILKNDKVLNHLLEQIVERYTTIHHIITKGTKEEQLRHFYQNFSKWNCQWCLFRDVCHQRVTIDGLLRAGVLVPRKDHHEPPKETEAPEG